MIQPPIAREPAYLRAHDGLQLGVLADPYHWRWVVPAPNEILGQRFETGVKILSIQINAGVSTVWLVPRQLIDIGPCWLPFAEFPLRVLAASSDLHNAAQVQLAQKFWPQSNEVLVDLQGRIRMVQVCWCRKLLVNFRRMVCYWPREYLRVLIRPCRFRPWVDDWVHHLRNKVWVVRKGSEDEFAHIRQLRIRSKPLHIVLHPPDAIIVTMFSWCFLR
mmetsp:Transcript_12224/g.33384  ORF Transcript_12224/g.33384 Transcript_12224/m.33384 type:complete len:218 (+) Transcript_12224:141-794(+)